ncbi:MAG: DUF2155 domain-containing protein [Alphaproteobacteria bacterium]|nr:DUF2155 domain-containing protein [Alphaproteobacteria bacterium]
MKRAFFFALLLTVFLPASSAHAVIPTQEKPIVVLRALDKMTARVEELNLPVGETVPFGSMRIKAETCRVTLPEESPPESAAHLDVKEIKPGTEKEVTIFQGWMFASSPALSAMEHPIYDIWVIGCKDKTSPTK